MTEAWKLSLPWKYPQKLHEPVYTVYTDSPQIRPPSDYWKVTVEPQPNCINQTNSLLVAGVVNTLTDFVVVALPIRTVWSLQLRSKQAVPVVLLFAFGFLSCCCGIVRTYYTYKVSTSYDAVWDSYPVWMTAALELYIGIVRSPYPPYSSPTDTSPRSVPQSQQQSPSSPPSSPASSGLSTRPPPSHPTTTTHPTPTPTRGKLRNHAA